MIPRALRETIVFCIATLAGFAMAGIFGGTAQAQLASFAWKTAVYGQANTDATPGSGDAVIGKKSMVIDSSGNIYVTGTTSNGANSDYLTVKYSAAGAILWRTVTNGTSNGADVAYALAVDASGNVAVSGLSDNGSNFDYLTVKYNAAGIEQWRKTFNGASNRNDEAYAVAFDALGNVIVTGASFVATNRNNHDYVTVKYDAAGFEQWRKSADGSGFGNDRPNALALDAAGNIFVTGFSANGTNVDYLTVKYDPAGNVLWRMVMNGDGNGHDVAFALVVDDGGNAYVAGKSFNGANYDYLTVKYDTDGVQKWRAVLNGPGNVDDAAFAIAVDTAGNVIVTGQIDLNPVLGLSVFNPRYLTVKYNPAGELTWQGYMNGSGTGNDISTALAIDAGGNVYATGFTTNGADNDLAFVKYAPDGAELWKRAVLNGIGSVNGGKLMVAAVDPVGSVVVAGYRSNGTDNDFLVIKYSAGGTELWRANEGLNDQVSTSLSSGELYFGARALALDAAGNAYVTGRSDVGANGDFITARIDASGVTQWRVIANGTANGLDQAYAIALDGTGNVYVTGDSYAGGTSDFLTVKYDPAGNELWRVLTDGPAASQDLVRALAVDPAGDVIVTGITFGDGDFLTVKYNANLVEQWRQTAGTTAGSDDPVAIAVDVTRNVYVTGQTFDGTNYGYLTVKYNAGGTLQWSNIEPGSSSPPKHAYALAVDTVGNAVVAGKPTIKYRASDGVELWRVSDFQAYALAIDAAGNVYVGGAGGVTAKYRASDGAELWRATVGATGGGDIVNAMVLDADQNVYVTSQNFLNGVSDFTTVKYSPGGIERWRATTPTLGNVTFSPTALALDAQRGVLVAGNTLTPGLAPAISVVKYRQSIAAPTIISAAPGNGTAAVSFTPPASDGGAPISGYTATCNVGGFSASGIESPLSVTGLANGTTYQCSVTASNAFGVSAASALISVVPSATAPLVLLTVHSRKVHAGLGHFDWRVDTGQPIDGNIAVEPRNIAGGHTLLFRFNGTVNAAGSAVPRDAGTTLIGTASAVAAGDTVAVNLSEIPDRSRVKVVLSGVNGSTSVDVSLGFLVGDFNKSYAVNASDISAVKAHMGQPVDLANYLFDVDVSGVVNQIDVNAVKARAGISLP